MDGPPAPHRGSPPRSLSHPRGSGERRTGMDYRQLASGSLSSTVLRHFVNRALARLAQHSEPKSFPLTNSHESHRSQLADTITCKDHSHMGRDRMTQSQASSRLHFSRDVRKISLYDPHLDQLARRWTPADRRRLMSIRQQPLAARRTSLWARIRQTVRQNRVITQSPILST